MRVLFACNEAENAHIFYALYRDIINTFICARKMHLLLSIVLPPLSRILNFSTPLLFVLKLNQNGYKIY